MTLTLFQHTNHLTGHTFFVESYGFGIEHDLAPGCAFFHLISTRLPSLILGKHRFGEIFRLSTSF